MTTSRTAVAVAAGANLTVAVVKFVAAAVSGSAALLAEGVHSVVDTIDQLLLLLGQHRGSKPPDDQHPFGYGMELYFWSTVVCTIIFSLGGGGSFLEGLFRVLHRGGDIRAVGWSYVALAVALVSESASLVVGYRKMRKRYPKQPLWRVFRTSKDPSILTVILEDSAAVVGVGIAFVGVLLSQLLHDDLYDGIAAMCIGLLLCIMSALLARESRSLVIGESADRHLVARLRELLSSDACVDRVGGVLTMQFGPDQVLVNTELEFRDGLTSDELERAIDRIETRIREDCPIVKRIFVELGALKPSRRPGGPSSRPSS